MKKKRGDWYTFPHYARFLKIQIRQYFFVALGREDREASKEKKSNWLMKNFVLHPHEIYCLLAWVYSGSSYFCFLFELSFRFSLHQSLSFLRWNELKPARDFILFENLTLMLIQFFTCVQMNGGKTKLNLVRISYQPFDRNEISNWHEIFMWTKFTQSKMNKHTHWILLLMGICVKLIAGVISLSSIWQIWNFILGDKISCKYYPKWNAYACSSKYWVTLKCSWNETSCEKNLFLCWFKISDWYELTQTKRKCNLSFIGYRSLSSLYLNQLISWKERILRLVPTHEIKLFSHIFLWEKV